MRSQRSQPRVRSVPTVIRLLGRSHLKIVCWFWVVVLVGWAGTATTMGTFTDIRASVWEWFSRAAPKYFLLVIGILAGSVYLPRFVAYGITRRDVRAGAAVLAPVLASAFAAMVLLGHGIEYAAFSATGVIDQFSGAYPVASAGDAVESGVRVTLLCLAYLCSGWLLGAGYYRYGVWRGSLFLPPALLPLAGAEAALDAGGLADRFAVGVVVAAACVGAGVVLAHAVTRDIPIRPTPG